MSRLDTDRLVLRPLTMRDAPRVADLLNDSDVAEPTLNIPHPYRLEYAEDWVGRHAAQDPASNEIVFAIECRTDGLLIGAVGLVVEPNGWKPELGFWLGKAYWNQGYMTEAVIRVLHFAFDDLSAKAVRAAAFPENASSIRVQEKAGMVVTGREVRRAPARATDREMVVREITRAAWRA